MEHPKYLIDSNAVIDYLGKKLPARGMDFMHGIIDDIPNISVITKMEVLGFNASDKEDMALLNDFVNDSVVIDLNDGIVEETILIRKTNKTKLPDAIIAATAKNHGLILLTRNIFDFKSIPGLEIVNPYKK